MDDRLILFGRGGHAKVVLEAVLAGQPTWQIAILDDSADAEQSSLLGFPVMGGRAWLERSWTGVSVMPAIGGNQLRAALSKWLTEQGRDLATIVHPAAVVSPSARIGRGCFLAAGAIVNAEAELGEGVILNTAASVDHDCTVGRFSHIAPGARLCGNVQIGERTLIGVGSSIAPGIRVGSNVTVGAGSAVIRDVADGVRVAGTPAAPID